MLQGLTALIACRIAALILVVALSGAGGLAPRARAAEHHCQCHPTAVNGRHVCDCPICRLAGLRAAARDASASAAEHAAAMRALDVELARAEGAAGPACSSQCDPTRRPSGVSSSTELFTLPRLPTLPHRETVERAGGSPAALACWTSRPELPPPRGRQS